MRGIGAGTRIFELLDRSPIIPPDSGVPIDSSRRGLLMFENVRFEYHSRKGTEILKDLHIEVGVGESVAVVYVTPVLPLITELMDFRQWSEWKRKVFDPLFTAPLLRPS